MSEEAQIAAAFEHMTAAMTAMTKALDAFPDPIEALVISEQDSEPPSATPLYRIDANLGWGDEIIATDLYRHIALVIAHALDAVYACGVYENGERL
jgi:hypothetical protein